MNHLEQLIEHFKRFPGIGPRQARRFAMHLLGEQSGQNEELGKLISTLKQNVQQCTQCCRFVARRDSHGFCTLCSLENRDHSKLLIVAYDTDVTAVERAGTYDGKYFVFGGTIPILEKTDNRQNRGGLLKSLISHNALSLSEIILAFPANPDGDNTARFVESILKSTLSEHTHLTLTHLGRGLSTGSELEYADPDTITFALQNRK